jgi:hypothetical protein
LSRYNKGNIIIVVIMLNHALLRCTLDDKTAGASVSAREILATKATVSKITIGIGSAVEPGSSTKNFSA